MDINSNNRRYYYNLVPIALELYLFPFRTQKSSPVAPIILLCGKLGRCQIINYPPERVDFCVYICYNIVKFDERGCKQCTKALYRFGRLS